MDTIFAMATPAGKSGVAVFRISGVRAREALEALGVTASLKPRKADLREIFSPITKAKIDKAIIIYFPSPNSFTGEDVVELHTHGSHAVIAMVAKALLSISGVRLAEPGEFSRRALLNGKMDLTEIEGLADLIDAETEMQQKQALRQMSGGLSKIYESWREEVIKALAHLEAYIDFPDEDLPPDVRNNFVKTAQRLQKSINGHLHDNRCGEILRSGIYAVIVGAPNVGKSSLLNYLAKRDIAIVSHVAGTTRDVIEVSMNIAGFPVTIADTAGIRENVDEVEKEGIKRALERAESADMRIVILDSNSSPDFEGENLRLINENSIVLLNKIDEVKTSLKINNQKLLAKEPICISIKTGEGMTVFMEKLTEILENKFNKAISNPVITRERYRRNLEDAKDQLQNFINMIQRSVPPELCAEHLRSAAVAIGKITGRIDTDELLDEIFSSFCIGK